MICTAPIIISIIIIIFAIDHCAVEPAGKNN